MKSIKALLLAVACFFAVSASAQEKGVTYEYVPHWYLQLNGGAQYTLGEASFSKLISPNAQIGVGYNFNPVLGIRLSANGWQSKGGWSNDVNYKWNYVAPQLDLTLNLSNAISGFNPKRIVDVSIFAGAACNIAWNNDEANNLKNEYQMTYLWDGTMVRPFGRAGLDIDFKVSSRVAINLEAAANIGGDKYNSKRGHNSDWYFNGLLGVKVALGKTYNKIVPAPVYVPEPKPEPTPQPTPVVKKVTEKAINVFFKIRSSEINDVENIKVQELIAFLKENPEAKVVVTGYADAGTGNPRINMKYSQDRANSVTKALVDAGISPDRITKEAKGDTVQPFAENDANRVCIAISK